MPRVRLTPWGLAYTAYRLWRRLPPAQRALVLEVARRQGPKVARSVKARRRRPGPPL